MREWHLASEWGASSLDNPVHLISATIIRTGLIRTLIQDVPLPTSSTHLVLQLVPLEVGQSVVGPVLQLVPSHECHHARVLVPSAATTNIDTNLKLPVKFKLPNNSQNYAH